MMKKLIPTPSSATAIIWHPDIPLISRAVSKGNTTGDESAVAGVAR